MTRSGTAPAAPPARSWAISASACASGSNRTDVILIVEDDPQVARLIALVLQRHGRDCQIVADGQTALSRVKERSEEHTSELQSRRDLVCRLLLEKKKKKK